MKIRNDFISNSSSCSFIIHLKTDNDVTAIREIFDKIDKYRASFSFSYENDGWFNDEQISSKEDFVKHTLVKVDAGEDHYPYYYERYEEILEMFQNAYKFRIYADPDAHVTTGTKIPKNIEL